MVRYSLEGGIEGWSYKHNGQMWCVIHWRVELKGGVISMMGRCGASFIGGWN